MRNSLLYAAVAIGFLLFMLLSGHVWFGVFTGCNPNQRDTMWLTCRYLD